MGRQPCCDKREGLKKGPWSADEDRKLVAFISVHGLRCWRQVPKLAGLQRCGKSCRLRWINYLRPDLKRGMLSPEEEQLIIHLHASYGNKWSRIAAQLPGRTDNEIKNCWNTRIKKKLKDMGIDPVTHKALSHMTGAFDPPKGQGMNGPSSLGTPPLLYTEPLNTSAYHYNMMAKRLQEAALLATMSSPNSVMSPQVTTSLSHTPPTTNSEDEHSTDYSVDSISHDHSMDSNVQASVHELASEEMFQGDPHMMFTCQQNGIQNAPCMLSACHVPIGHEIHMPPHLHNPSHMSHNAPYMHNPPHMLHNVAHMQNPPRTLQHASHITPQTLCMSQLQASHPVQPLSAYELQALQASLPTSKIEGTGIPSSSSRMNGSIDGCNEVIEVDASAIKEENERTMASNYMRNFSPCLSPSMIKCLHEGGVPQASQSLYERRHEEATSASVSTAQGGDWSNMMLDMFFTGPGEAERRETCEMSRPLNETSQDLGQNNVASSYNSISRGQWSNMDCLWGEALISLTN